MPLYAITDHVNRLTRLVDAPNPARALRHVTGSQFGILSASPSLVAKLMGTGIKLETTEPETQPETQPEGY